MLLYKGSKKPDILKDMENVISGEVMGTKYFMITRDKSIFDDALKYTDSYEWFERDGYSVAQISDEISPSNIIKAAPIGTIATQVGKHKWLIPVIRNFITGCTLPSSIKISLGGGYTKVVDDEFISLSEVGNEIYDTLIVDKTTPTYSKIAEWLYELLKASYSITMEDVLTHNMIHTTKWIEPLYVAIDMESMEKLFNMTDEEKKSTLLGLGLNENTMDIFLQFLNGE